MLYAWNLHKYCMSTIPQFKTFMVFPVVKNGCESWTIKKAECRRTDYFELWCWRRLENSLDCKEIKPVDSKGNQSWIFIGRTDAKAETPILWPPDAKNWLIEKDPDAGKDWRQEDKGTTEDEMVGWHHQLNGQEFWVSSRSSWWTGKPGVLQSMGSQSQTWLRDWTELNWTNYVAESIGRGHIGWAFLKKGRGKM